jgi:hypothetical protein
MQGSKSQLLKKYPKKFPLKNDEVVTIIACIIKGLQFKSYNVHYLFFVLAESNLVKEWSSCQKKG